MYRFFDHVNSRYAEVKTPTSIEDLQLIGQDMRTYLTSQLEYYSQVLMTDFEINSLKVKSNKGEIELLYDFTIGAQHIQGITESHYEVYNYIQEILKTPQMLKLVDAKIAEAQNTLIDNSLDTIEDAIAGNENYPWDVEYDLEMPNLNHTDTKRLLFWKTGQVTFKVRNIRIHYKDYDIRCEDGKTFANIYLGEESGWVGTTFMFGFDVSTQTLVPSFGDSFPATLDRVLTRLIMDYEKSNSLVDFNKELLRKLRNYYLDEDVTVDRFGRPTIGDYTATDLTVDPVNDPYADDAFRRVKKNYARYNKRNFDREAKKEAEIYDGEEEIEI